MIKIKVPSKKNKINVPVCHNTTIKRYSTIQIQKRYRVYIYLLGSEAVGSSICRLVSSDQFQLTTLSVVDFWIDFDIRRPRGGLFPKHLHFKRSDLTKACVQTSDGRKCYAIYAQLVVAFKQHFQLGKLSYNLLHIKAIIIPRSEHRIAVF